MEKSGKDQHRATSRRNLRRPLTSPGIPEIVQVEKRSRKARSRVDLISVTITNLAGSAPAILIHLIWFALWILINMRAVPAIAPFDPFPFGFLTMVVSLEAIFLTLFVLITQNRMSVEADRRARLDLEINILAERETTMILRMLNQISKHLEISGGAQSELEDLLKETRVEDLAKKLDEAFPPQ
jgi:uncharacterized membrane protein